MVNSFAIGKSKVGLVSKVSTNNGYTPAIINSYQYANAICTYRCNDYPTVTLSQLNDKTWYVGTLKFDNNFQLLDIDSGYFPRVMKTNLLEEVPNQEYVLLPQN